MARSQQSIINGMKREHDRLIEAGRELERLWAEDRARIDCATNNGWLSDDLECAGEDGPACWTHLLAEARRQLADEKGITETAIRHMENTERELREERRLTSGQAEDLAHAYLMVRLLEQQEFIYDHWLKVAIAKIRSLREAHSG